MQKAEGGVEGVFAQRRKGKKSRKLLLPLCQVDQAGIAIVAEGTARFAQFCDVVLEIKRAFGFGPDPKMRIGTKSFRVRLVCEQCLGRVRICLRENFLAILTLDLAK
jgi:hypothetical protein